MSVIPVIWASKLQDIVALSSTEVEYVGLSMAARESGRLHRLIDSMGLMSCTGQCSITLWADNQGSIKFVRNTANKKRTRCTDVRYHFFRDVVDRKLVIIKYSCTEDMVEDITTKALEIAKHENFAELSGLGTADGLHLQ